MHSWPDHVLTLGYNKDDVMNIKCIDSSDNFSDHALNFEVDCDWNNYPSAAHFKKRMIFQYVGKKSQLLKILYSHVYLNFPHK